MVRGMTVRDVVSESIRYGHAFLCARFVWKLVFEMVINLRFENVVVRVVVKFMVGIAKCERKIRGYESCAARLCARM